MSSVSIPFENDPKRLEIVKDFYAGDVFALKTIGIEILAAAEDHSYLSMPVAPHLFNAKNGVQGGALFALADLAAAVADYCNGWMNTTVEGNIQYLSVPTGSVIYAHAYACRRGKTLGYYRCDMLSETGELIATASFTYYHFQAK